MSSTHAALSAASDDRKARLAKLKNLKRKQPGDEIVAPESERAGSPAVHASTTAAASDENQNNNEDEAQPPDVTGLYLSGRNYDADVRGAKLGFEANPATGQATLEAAAAGVEDAVRARAAAGQAKADLDMDTLRPKKANWDLDRMFREKYRPLEVATENACHKLVLRNIEAKKAAKQKSAGPGGKAGAEDGDGELPGMDGVALVEGLKMREREEEEEARRAREDDEDVV
ncbi:cwf18 pre-mRNA splicing factor-domain-containing protein [Xylariomycetidae sp. FL0641]|nr:cwf18 pre-mRNA splicing factor-domain-containing protein [Xylariomycetidae sp. FL0641]